MNNTICHAFYIKYFLQCQTLSKKYIVAPISITINKLFNDTRFIKAN